MMIKCGHCGEEIRTDSKDKDGQPLLLAEPVTIYGKERWTGTLEALVCPNCRTVLAVLPDPDRAVQRGAGLEP